MEFIVILGKFKNGVTTFEVKEKLYLRKEINLFILESVILIIAAIP